MINLRILCIIWIMHSSISVKGQMQSWWSLNAETSLSKKWSLELSEQVRLSHDPLQLRGSYTSLGLEYKLGKGWRMLGGFRFSTSARFDRLRYGLGLQKRFELGKSLKGELRLRALYQYQHHWFSMPEYDINPPMHNIRFMARYDFKLIKKTRMSLFAEPLWRYESGELFFHRYRAGIAIERELPGPFSLSVGYTLQHVFSKPSITHIARVGLNYTFKRSKKSSAPKPEKSN